MRHGKDVISVKHHCGEEKLIVPLEISAQSQEEAANQAEYTADSIRFIRSHEEGEPIIITEDKWHSQRLMMESRLLAHLKTFNPIFARNCEVRRIDKTTAKAFLEANHSYGYATCKYCYGLFFKRNTGHVAEEISKEKAIGLVPGDLVAVATFSNARKWMKGDKEIRSYEWTRYASLPDVRLSGGMGRLLKAFIKEVQPDDIMSYADLEWSTGEVYSLLGFSLEGHKAPVTFTIDKNTWIRTPIRANIKGDAYFQNFGSNKYRLKLTDYK